MLCAALAKAGAHEYLKMRLSRRFSSKWENNWIFFRIFAQNIQLKYVFIMALLIAETPVL